MIFHLGAPVWCSLLLLAQSALSIPSAFRHDARASSSPEPFPQITGTLSHSGTWLTDEAGRVITFHGINVANKLPPYTPQAQGFNREHAELLAREGFGVVRVWIFWNAFEPQNGVWNDTSLEGMRDFIGLLNTYNIRTIVNFAHLYWGEYFGGMGFPSWGVLTDGLQTRNMTPYEHIFTDRAMFRAMDHFWNNTPHPDNIGLQDHFNRAWIHAASFLKDTPGLLGYDIINEPHGGSQSTLCVTPVLGCPLFDTTLLTPFYKRAVAAIRSVDAVKPIFYNHEILYGAGFGFPSVSAGDDPNLIYTSHFYPPTNGTALNVTSGVYYLTGHKAVAQRNGDGYLFTEFGATDDLSIIQADVIAADAQNTGWMYWAWYSTEPNGNVEPHQGQKLRLDEGIVWDPTQPPTGSNLKDAKLNVLARPYPYIVAGTPESWNYDVPTRTFRLRYRTTGVNGIRLSSTSSSIVVPSRAYPNGYIAAVEGANVTSADNAFSLNLATQPGVERVTVVLSSR